MNSPRGHEPRGEFFWLPLPSPAVTLTTADVSADVGPLLRQAAKSVASQRASLP